MAELVSTTITPTYSDPLRAQSIKALEQRHKDMLAQAAKAGAITPENTQTPMQGFGHLANQLGDSFQQSRVDQAAAAQRQMLAQTMANMDPNNPKPAEIAAINSADPEMARQMLTQLAEYRRAQMQDATSRRGQDLTRESSAEGHNVTRQGNQLQSETSLKTNQATVDATLSGQSNQAAMETERLAAAKAAAEEKVRTDEIARQQGYTHTDAAAAQKVLDEQVAAAKLAETNAATAKEAARIKAEEKARDPKTVEAIEASETNYRKGLTHIDNLEEAAKILEHPGGIYTGAAQGAAPVIGGIPGVGGMLVDKEKAQRTSRFNTLVGEDAVRDMSSTLKGSSTNFELQKFEKMKNDPNISDATRIAQLRKAQAAARADLEAQAKTAKAIGGDTERVDRAMSASKGASATGMSEEDIAKSLANAQAAVTSGKWTKEQANAKLKAAGVPRGL